MKKKWIQLTGLFKVHSRFGDVVEISKKIGNFVQVCPFSRHDIKVDRYDNIYVTVEGFFKKQCFFKKFKD